MRIAYVVGVFPSTRETFVSNEVIDLTRRGVEVDVFSWKQPVDEMIHPEVEESGVLQRVHYFRYRYLVRVLRSPVFWRSLFWVTAGRHRTLFRTLRDKTTAAYFAALIAIKGHRHVHGHFAGLARPVSELAGITHSFTAHCYQEEGMGEQGKAGLTAAIEKASLVIAASEFVRRGLCSLVSAEECAKVHVVRCGIDTQKFQPNGDVEKEYDVVCVAGFGPTKGIEYLVRATALLKQRRPRIRVLHVGGPAPWYPTYAEELVKERSKCGVEDAFEFAGPVESDKVTEYLRRSKVFALPCVVTDDGQMDGLPVALMEAGAIGLPLVSTAVAGIPELVQDGVTGIVVPQRDPEALAEAIGKLLDDDRLRERLGQNARNRVEEEFSRERSGERLLECFRPFIA